MSMHTKPRTMFTKECRECSGPFESSSKTSQYCPGCRPIVRAKKMNITRKLRAEKLKQDRIDHPERTIDGIDPKWLVRGTPTNSGQSDAISNGSY